MPQTELFLGPSDGTSRENTTEEPIHLVGMHDPQDAHVPFGEHRRHIDDVERGLEQLSETPAIQPLAYVSRFRRADVAPPFVDKPVLCRQNKITPRSDRAGQSRDK